MGSIFFAVPIMSQYATVPVVQLGDGYVGVMPKDWPGLEVWGTRANLPGALRQAMALSTPANFATKMYASSAELLPERLEQRRLREEPEPHERLADAAAPLPLVCEGALELQGVDPPLRDQQLSDSGASHRPLRAAPSRDRDLARDVPTTRIASCRRLTGDILRRTCE